MSMMKSEIKRQLRALEEEIKGLEIKRSRSQAALIEALISEKKPDPQEVQFFRTFTADIEVKRDKMDILKAQLAKLKSGK